MKNLFGIFLLMTTYILNGQNIVWEKSFGGTGGESGSSLILKNGNLISLGLAGSYDFDVVGLKGSGDFWLLEIDSMGTILRSKCLGGSRLDQGNKIISCFDGGFILAGSTLSNDSDVYGRHGISSDMWVIKIDSLWNPQWQKCIGSIVDDQAYSIIQSSDSGFLVVGTVRDSSGDVNEFFGGYRDIFAAKLNKFGAIDFVRSLGGSDIENEEVDCVQTADGGFLIMGSGSSSDYTIPPNHVGSIYIFKLDSVGNISWVKTYGGTGGESSGQIILESDGSFEVCGSTSSNDGDVIGHIGGPDVWLFKASSNGTLLWQSCIGSNGLEFATSFDKTSDGGFIIGANSEAGDGIIQNYGGQDCWVIKTDSIGQYQWSKIFGGSLAEKLNSIKEVRPNVYAFCGESFSSDFDVSYQHGIWPGDLWMVEISDASLSIDENQNDLKDVFTYYASGNMLVKYISSTNNDVLISVFDLLGKEIYSGSFESNQGINQISLNANFTSGYKLIKIECDTGGVTSKLFVP